MPGAMVNGGGTGPVVPQSRRELRKNFPGAEFSPHYQFLDNLSLRDVVYFFDDFDELVLDTTNRWSVGAGASATTWAILQTASVAGQDGMLRGVSGSTAATSALQLFRPVMFKGDNFCGMEVYWKSSVLVNKRVEIGFANAAPAINTTIINNITTPTFNTVTDAAVYMFDNASATNTMGLYTLNSDGATAAKTAFTRQLPTVNVYTHVRLEIKTDSAWLWVNGDMVASLTGADASGAIEGGTALLPIISIKSADTVQGNFDVDFFKTTADRLNQA